MTEAPLLASAAPITAERRLSDPAAGGEPTQVAEQTLQLWRALAPLPPERRRWALAKGRVEAAGAGQGLAVSDEVAVVVAGVLCVHVGGSGLSSDILGPGDVLSTGSGRRVAGDWITDGLVYRTSLADWTETAGVDGLSHLLEAVDRSKARLERGLRCASRHRATERVADLLCALHDVTGLTTAPLSQERLGVMLGLRRTTVNASCRALHDAGLTRTARGQIRLTSIDALRNTACGCRRMAQSS